MKYKVFINETFLSHESDSLGRALRHARSKAKNPSNYVELWCEDTLVNYWNK